ncbi:MAG: GTPase Era [Kiritimatiellia bacterium]
MSVTPIKQKHCAIVGIVGRTNSGKSTLLNLLVGEKISIVSPTSQTTRNTVRGILTERRGQLVFLDTPGLHRSEGHLGTLLNQMARAASAGVDILMIVFDGSKRPQLEDDGWMRRASKTEQQVVFVLNKADKKSFCQQPFLQLWNEIVAETESGVQVQWVETNALNRGGADELLGCLFSIATVTEEYLFPADIISDYPRKLAIADVIREKFLKRLRDELPHELGILVESIAEHPNRWNISVVVYVNRASQKGMVIGAGGAMLKMVRERAEPELSAIFGTRVKLDLWVKVESNWFKNSRLLQQMGYVGQL